MPETPPANDEPDLTKTHTGYIISYNYFEEKGKIQGPSEEKYSFDVKNITDKSASERSPEDQQKNNDSYSGKVPAAEKRQNYLAVSIKRGTASFYLPSARGMPQLKLRQKRQPQHQQICPCQLLFSRQQRQRRKHLHLLLKNPFGKSEDGKQLSAAISHWTAKKAYSKVVEVCKTYMDKDCWEDAFYSDHHVLFTYEQ